LHFSSGRSHVFETSWTKSFIRPHKYPLSNFLSILNHRFMAREDRVLITFKQQAHKRLQHFTITTPDYTYERVQHFTTSDFSARNFSFAFVLAEKRLNRETKLLAILRRHTFLYCQRWKKIYSPIGS